MTNRQLDSVVLRLLDIWKESAVGGGTDWPPLEQTSQGAMENAIDVWVNFVEMERCRARGDLGTATGYADVAVTAAYAAMGLEDDFALIWPAAVMTALDAGDLDLADRLIEPVWLTPHGLITPNRRAAPPPDRPDRDRREDRILPPWRRTSRTPSQRSMPTARFPIER